MAQAFSPKNYFKKIYTPEILVEFYSKHEIVALFEITDSTPRKTVTDIFMDFYKSIPPEKKIDIEKELALIHTLSTKYSVDLFISLLKKKGLPYEETQIECKSDQDKVLYYFLFNKDIFDEVLFFHDFYISRGYMLYEAKEVELISAELSMTELAKEFKRIANKDERTTECDVIYQSLNDLLYVNVTFEGASHLTPAKDKTTGEIDRTKTTRKIEQVKIVYLPKDKEILISYTGSKHEKLIFLDTFLRIVCSCGYEDKSQSFDLTPCKRQDFDFKTTNKGVPLLTWKIKAVTVSFGGNEKSKKKMRLSLPSTVQEYGLAPLYSTLEELTLTSQLQSFTIENIALNFSFQDGRKLDKSVLVSCSLSRTQSSLCPLFPYDRYARTLLKLSGIDNGFIENVKKDTEKVNSKWVE